MSRVIVPASSLYVLSRPVPATIAPSTASTVISSMFGIWSETNLPEELSCATPLFAPRRSDVK